MRDPPADSVSIDHVNKYNSRKHGVHQSSGIYNKAFYELAVTQKWGVLKAFQVHILYHIIIAYIV